MVGTPVTWADLTGTKSSAYSVANLVNNATITSGAGGVADIIVGEACDMIYRRLRHWRMMPAPVTGSLTIGSDLLAEPSDMLEPFFLCTTGTNFQEIKQKTPADVIRSWSYDGSGNRIEQQPMIYYFDQTNFHFDSEADQAYPYALLYYQQPAALSSSNQTNFLTQFCFRLLKAGIMVAATEWVKQIGSGQYGPTYWMEEFENELLKAQKESDRAKRAIDVGAQFVGGGGMGVLPMYHA